MPVIEQLHTDTINALFDRVSVRLADATVLEDAAQAVTDEIFESLPDALHLVRIFATVPYGRLPEDVRSFVDTLAKKAGIAVLLNDDTPILCLLGTRGRGANWNSRKESDGHVGIPLASADFVDSIPMVSRLLHALGAPFDWIDTQDTEVAAGGSSGLFYVGDASNEVDAKGRKIIAAQDFVTEHGVDTVFGMGTQYGTPGAFLTMIAFASEAVSEEDAARFLPLAYVIKGATERLVREGKIFAD